MGEIKIDLANVITIALVGFAGVWVINRTLAHFGKQSWSA